MNDYDTQYYILVDYDNLEKNQKLQDNEIITAMNHMLNRLDRELDFFVEAKALQKINILLYGGWYDQKTRTKKSIRIKQEISKPRPSLFLSQHNVNLNPYIDISHGLMSFPGRTFYGTFRHPQAKFKIKNLQSCCEDGAICVDFVRHLNEHKECCYCSADLSDLLYCDSQKMVDTMICCDLLYLSQKEGSRIFITIVSSDDDLIPPIYQQCKSNNRIYHLLTKEQTNSSFDNFYSSFKPSNYKQTTW